MLNKKGSCHCRRIEVQSKETLTAPGVQLGFWHSGSGGARKHCRPTGGGHSSLDWRERLRGGTATPSKPGCRNRQFISLVGRKTSLVLMTRGTRCRKAEAWQVNGTWTMVTLCVTQSWCCPFLHYFDVANDRTGAERNSLKTEVSYHVNDLDAAPPQWRVGDVRSLAKTSAVTDGSITLGVAVWSRQFVADQLLSKADPHNARARSTLPGPADGVRLLRESLGVTATQSWRNKVQRRFTVKSDNCV